MFPEQDVRRLVGGGAFARGLQYAKAGHVLQVLSPADRDVLVGRVAGNGVMPYTVTVDLTRGRDGLLRPTEGECTCPVGWNCKHVAALLLHTRERSAAGPPAGATASWRAELDRLIPVEDRDTRHAELALQLELGVPGLASGPYARSAAERGARLGMRPVRRSQTGRWVRTGVSWRDLRYRASSELRSDQVQILRTIMMLDAASDRFSYYPQADQWVYLDDIEAPQIWDLLGEAAGAGLPLLHAGKGVRPVTISPTPAEVSLDLHRTDTGISLVPALTVAGEPLDLTRIGLVGARPHGLYWWREADGIPGPSPACEVTLARLKEPVGAELKEAVLRGQALSVPADAIAEFSTSYLPRLRRKISLTSSDDSFSFPEPPRPTLRLTLTHHTGHRAELAWDWLYRAAGDGQDGPAAGTRVALWPTAGERVYRDRDAEQQVLDSLDLPVRALPVLAEPAGGRLAARSALTHMDTVAFVTGVLPGLRSRDDVEVHEAGAPPEYRESASAPVIALSTTSRADDRDWFDLGVDVSIDGEEVPFDALFRALASGQEHLILPSGTYFPLDRAELVRLRSLIEEARALQDAPGTGLRISRFQAGLWEELEGLGIVTQQAEAWRRTVDALTRSGDAATPAATDPPASLRATLRPYQQDGFAWLATLYDHGLGGVLADDMGLGKTVQTLALIARVRERAGAAGTPPGAPAPAGPFLVVAPTSVVGNWVAEAGRFTPGLRAVGIAETAARRRTTLRDLAEGADVVVTSYTLFRLEYEEYAALPWAGLLLDEAQTIKNFQSKAYQCAKRLDTPFKLAITGTPMENNLLELWALLALTAPGLFPHRARFVEYYGKPIEKDGDRGRLAQLQRRISPLMLRRTKGQVVAELPAKQEQVIEVELGPRHRTIYQRHLQRERQKVLGLIDDLDKNRFAIFRSLTLLRQLSLDASLVDEAYAAVPSAKLDVLFEMLEDVVAEGHRVLIFSQFTSFLARVRERLDAAGTDYCYLDGRTRRRAEVIDRFRGGDAPVFLISLKAGGVGLNLTEADYCILLDPWWNPATEAQAIDRTHRIGQTRTVMVYRLVAKDTIEEKVMALKDGKAKLFESVMSDAALARTSLSPTDIRELLT